ncbi:MAG: NDP-sugar synthase [Deltaproteobacteria bacterium]|nr:NDP-sugar synthase [Deltaproteobacteria bacterium]
MKAGIIAAGVGSRLAQGGVAAPKPLVRLSGETLLDRAIREAAEAGARRVALIVNPVFPEVIAHLEARPQPAPLDLLIWESPSSLQSFLALKPYLEDSPFLLLTVDSVLAPGALAEFVKQAFEAKTDGALGLTAFQDDEKPLYVEVDDTGRIRSIGRGPSPYITAGCYFFKPQVFGWEAEARKRQLQALREFLAMLAAEGFSLQGIDVGPAVDVDHPEDITRAEAFLRKGPAALR